ncbi:hypothetical protein KI387_033183, partial [Taxus chinensis]
MASSMAWLCVLLIFVGVIPYPSSPTANADRALDLQALSSFKYSITSDPLNALLDWANITHPCNWSGVVCDSRNNVVSLILTGKQLEGVISPSLANISKLSSLDLSSNSFHGGIPPQLVQCSQLTRLVLSANSLTGAIPFDVGKLVRLQFLELTDNFLVGSIPGTIGNCTSLRTARLSNNTLSGPIPSAFGGCRSLRAVDLSSNVLQGQIPVNLSQLQSLEQFLNLSNNRLEGDIPAELGYLKLLTSMDLSSNMLTGSVPSQLGNLTKLRTLNLSNNQLDGPVPQVGILTSFNWSSFEGNGKLCGVNFSRPCSEAVHSHKHRRRITIVASVAAAAVFLISLFCFLFIRRYLRASRGTKEITRPRPGQKQKSTLQVATKSFNADNIIGSSSSSILYKGVTFGDGDIAVNVFKIENSKEVEQFFSSDVQKLRRISHRNLVKVRGFSFEDRFKALVTEHMPNGDLDSLIHGAGVERHGLTFDLSKRIDISISTAQALVHLHDYCETPIVHCHLKPTSIFLDDDFEARVSDFGTAKMLQNHLQQERRAASTLEGTISYLAPESEEMERVTPKADVFSFGILLMELVTRRRTSVSVVSEGGERLNLRQWIENGTKSGSFVTLVDPALTQNISERDGEKMLNLLKISLLCSKEIPGERP